jgi:hypothetical protein
MKGTEQFKKTIQTYLDERARTDELFAVTYDKPNKNIDDCITFILNQVKNSGCNGFADDEIYSLAVHYYDEETIDVGKPLSCNVVVNHQIVLTDEEKAAARQEAITRYQEEEIRKMRERRKPKPTAPQPEQPVPSLFDM